MIIFVRSLNICALRHLLWKIATNKTKARNIASCKIREALARSNPNLTFDKLFELFDASEAPLPAIMPTTKSSAMNVVQTLPGCMGERYGK